MTKKTKISLWIGLWSLVVSTLSFGAVTFAWISYHQPLSGITFVSGDLAFTSLETQVYRYEYPYFSGSTIVDYTGTGSVSENVLTSDSHTYAMNKFDPTYITLAHGGSVTQAYIGELNTNLVLKMSFALAYTTPIDYTLTLTKNTSYSNYVDSDSIQHYGISSFLNFVPLTSVQFDSLSSDKIAAADIVYYKVKNYSLSAASMSFASSNTLTFFSTSLTERPLGEGALNVTAYFNIDFDAALTAPFFTGERLGKDFILDMDYSLSWNAVERSAS